MKTPRRRKVKNSAVRSLRARNTRPNEQLRAGYDRLEPRQLLATDFGLNFTGSTYLTNSTVINPNMVGDIGTTHTIEAIVDRIAIFDRGSGAKIVDQTQSQFFVAAGGIVNTTITNSQVIFDKMLLRWVIVGEGGGGGNYIHLAISNTANPVNGWKALRFVGDSVGVRHNGDLSVGMDADALLITTRNPNAGTGFPLSVSIYTIPKVNLYQAAPTLTNMSRFENLDPAVYGDYVRSASSFEASDGRATFIGNLANGTRTCRFDVVGPAAAGATITMPQNIVFNLNPFAPLLNSGGLAPSFGLPARQESATDIYITNNQPAGLPVRPNIYADAVDVNGSLWFVQSVHSDWAGSGDSMVVVVYEITKSGYVSKGPTPAFGGPPVITIPANNRIQSPVVAMQFGDARGPNPWEWDLFNPSISVNEFNIVTVNYTISTEEYYQDPDLDYDGFATAATSTGITVNGQSQYDPIFDTIYWTERNTQFTDPPVFIQPGLAVYENNGFFPSTWSYRSATNFDPLDVNNFWSNIQWANTSGRWSSQVTELSPNRLVATITANDLNNVIEFRRHAANNTLLEVKMDGVITDLIPFSVLGRLVINGFDGADTYIIDYVNGDPIPEDGLEIDGMRGPDVIQTNDPNGGRFVVDQNGGGTYNEKSIFRRIEELHGGPGNDSFTVTDRLNAAGTLIVSSGFLAGSLRGNGGNDLFHIGSKNGTQQQSTGAARIGDSILGGTGFNTLSFETRMADTFLQLLGYGVNSGYEGRSITFNGANGGPIGGDQPSDRFFDINFVMGSLTHFDEIRQGGVGVFNQQARVLVDDENSIFETSGVNLGFFEVNGIGGSTFVDTFTAIRNRVNPLQLNGVGGDDIYYFSSDGANLQGTTAPLQGLLFAQGGTGNNVMWVSNRGATSGVPNGLILNNRISGIGEIAYNAIGGTFALNVWVTEFADKIDLHSFFQTNTLELFFLGGDDRVSIQDLSKAVINIYGGGGNDVYAIEKIQNIDLRNLSLIDLDTADSKRDRVTLVGTILDEVFIIDNNTFFDLNLVYVNIDWYGVEGRDGNDTFDIRSSNVELYIDGEGGDDIFNFSSDAPQNMGNVSSILQNVTIEGGLGRNRVNVSARTDSSAKNVTMTANSIVGLFPSTMYFYSAGGTFSILNGVGGIYLVGSAFGDVFDITGLDATDSLRIDTLAGDDQFFVQANAFGNMVLNGGDGSDRNTVTFGGTGSRTVTINDDGVTGDDRLFVYGTGQSDLINAGITSIRLVNESVVVQSALIFTAIYGLNGNDQVNATGGTAPNFQLFGGNGNDTFRFTNTTNITGLYIVGNDGDDTLVISGSLATTFTQFYGSNGKDFATIQGGALGDVIINGQDGDDTVTITVANSGNRYADVRDGGTGGADLATVLGNDLANSFVLNTTTVTHGGQTVKFSAETERLTVSMAEGNDTMTVNGSTAGITRVNGGTGADQVNVLNTALAPQLTIDGEDGNDVVTIRKTNALTRTIVLGGAGDDLFNVGSDLSDDNGLLDHIQGIVSIVGGTNTAGGQDRLYTNDHGSLAAYSYFMNRRYLGSIPGPQNIARPLFAGIVYDSTLELSRVDGTVYANFFTVDASPSTIFYIDGNAPSPSSINGDTIFLRSTFNDGHLLHITSPSLGSGYWDFTNGNKDVRFENIETPYAPPSPMSMPPRPMDGMAWSGGNNSGPQLMRSNFGSSSGSQSNSGASLSLGQLFGSVNLNDEGDPIPSWSNSSGTQTHSELDADLAFAGSIDLEV